MQNKTRLDAIKSVYGEDKASNNETVELKNETIVSWAIEGVDTIEDLESKYTNYEIEDFYKCVCNDNF